MLTRKDRHAVSPITTPEGFDPIIGILATAGGRALAPFLRQVLLMVAIASGIGVAIGALVSALVLLVVLA
jgi:hypothetical protein